MTSRAAVVAPGAGLSTGLLVAVLVIEALPYEFSAIIGLPVGLLAGSAVGLLVGWHYEGASFIVRSVADGAAGFGYAVALLLVIRYADVFGLRSAVTFERLVVSSVVVGVAVPVRAWLDTSRSRPSN
ncbi:MAG: hypothetical protein V5A21_03065 [Halapricum sp.]